MSVHAAHAASLTPVPNPPPQGVRNKAVASRESVS
jgi:hypothetical protein